MLQVASPSSSYVWLPVAVIMVSAFSFVGCDKTKNDGGNLSFETVATILLDVPITDDFENMLYNIFKENFNE